MKLSSKQKNVGTTLGIGSLVAALWSLDPVKFSEYLSLAMQQQISQFLVAFSVAAWIHSGRVKKEFKSVTEAINNLGSALRLDLSALGGRIESVEKIVKVVVSEVETLKLKGEE